MFRTLSRRHGDIGFAALVICLLLALTGCGGGNNEPEAEAAPTASAVIDAAGGSLVGPDGVRLDVPAGALDAPARITMTRTATGAPALLEGQSAAVYAITPHGLAFRKPAVLTFPAAALPGQSALQTDVLRAQPGGPWEVLNVPIAGAEGNASVLLDGLSFYGTARMGSTGPSRRTGVIQNILGWAAPAPGIESSSAPPARRIVERTVVRVAVSSSVDPWCGGTATVTSVWIRRRYETNNFAYELLEKKARAVTVEHGWARAVFEFDVSVGPSTEDYLFAGSSACDSPAPLPPNPPYYGLNSNPQAVSLQAVAVGLPTITQQPVDMQAAPGDTVNFSVAATAPDTLAVTWQRSDDGGANWVDAGANAQHFVFTLLPAQAASLWRAKVCNISEKGSNCLSSNPVSAAASSSAAPWQSDSLMAGSGTHSMAIDSIGNVLSWGSNNGGALGRSSPNPAPARVEGPAMRSVAAGAWYSVALSPGGQVYAWGWGANVGAAIGSSTDDNPLPRPVTGLTNVAGIATRYQHSLAVNNSGAVWGFGPEESLALGPMQGHRGVRQIPGLARMRQVAAGERHSLALAADGTVWSWGENGSGQLGAGAAAVGTARATPQVVAGLTNVIAIAAGSMTSFALRRDGSVWSWGHAALIGRSGDATAPAPIAGLSNMKRIASGHHTAWALTELGEAFGWGDNLLGQAGVGAAGAIVSLPVQLAPALRFVEMAGGEFHGMALVATAQGRRVYGFGSNGHLQLDGAPDTIANAPVGNGVALP